MANIEKNQVVAAIIRKGPKFLVGKRSLLKSSAPGFWSPISGKVESCESEEVAIVRECYEEVGIVVRPVQKITEFDIDQGKARLYWWLVEILEGEPYLKNDEHTEIGWFSVHEMRQMPKVFEEDIKVFAELGE